MYVYHLTNSITTLVFSLLRYLVEVEHIAAELQKEIAFQKEACEARRDIEAPGNKFLLTAYRDFVLPEARCLSRFITKLVSAQNSFLPFYDML